ncbi:unnamed protein product [Blepharisma stoltei]|uniref:Uncharacterized protein n=1 Tax=Blepharisma stoltei TaxID=1481888 RepID=A0AAU9IEA0_9CILI|nr:unnamed protein product [Blepharisma stoltei]
MSRYVINNSPEFTGQLLSGVTEQIRRELPTMISIMEREYPPRSDYQLDSLGNKKKRYSIYTGSGGNLYFYYNLYTKYSSEYKSCLEEAIIANLNSCQSNRNTTLGFLTGRSGIYAITAAASKTIKYVEDLCRDENLIPESENELLNGLAGYIYSIIFIIDRWSDVPLREDLIALLNRTVDELVRRGNNYGMLKYEWPIGRGKYYLGGAHGSIGVIMMLLQSRKYLQNHYDHVIRDTLRYLLSLRFPSGNFPSSEGKTRDDLVHFCHGATGAVPMLCQAFLAFQDQNYLDAAIRAGNVIWERGLIKKGKGVCHGISGNGYAFLSLYKATLDNLWLYRAQCFADKMLNDQNLNREIENYEDSQRLVTGMPDRPFSLMEGLAGNILFYLDLLNPQEAKFPAYEI